MHASLLSIKLQPEYMRVSLCLWIAVIPGQLTELETQEDMLLFHIHDIHSFQTDAHTHGLTATSVKEALGWLVYLTHEESTSANAKINKCKRLSLHV